MGFSKVRPYKIIYTTSIFRFLVSSKSLQSFILYTFNDIFQCQRLSTTLVIYVWMLWGWRLPLPRPLTAAQAKKKKGNIVAIQMRHMAETVAITWKSGRACPQEELSSLHEAWEAVKVPRMNAAAFLAFCSVFSYFVL